MKDRYSKKEQIKEQRIKIALLLVPFLLFVPVIFHFIIAFISSFSPIDGYLVLGGTGSREAYAAALCSVFPERIMIISGGSDGPCIANRFQDYGAPTKNVTVEGCATSTFENYYYSVPLLKKMGLKHVGLVTTDGHMPRAATMGSILASGQGIALTPCSPPGFYEEVGHNESSEKTFMDVIRAMLWLWPSQYCSIECHNIHPLSSFDAKKAYTKDCPCGNSAVIDSLQEYYKNYIRSHRGHNAL